MKTFNLYCPKCSKQTLILQDNLEEQIKQWVISADKYHYLLESEEEYIAKEITKICIEFTKDFTEWRDNHSWEHDYREQHTHTLDEQIEIFTR